MNSIKQITSEHLKDYAEIYATRKQLVPMN